MHINFLASRCAEQCCNAHREMTIGLSDLYVAARYPPFGDMRGAMCKYLCASGGGGYRGSSARLHDDSLKPRLCILIHIVFVALCICSKGVTIACLD